MSKTNSRSVFIGNIPYGKSIKCPCLTSQAHNISGLTEEQITDIFSSAGKVLSFRLVYDRESGRPKGFGFAEYPDAGNIQSHSLFLQQHQTDQT